MKLFNFATIINETDSELQISHLPLLLEHLEPSKQPYGSLVGHMAKQNPQATQWQQATKVLCIFHGPHAYISPTWYINHPAVPTWNYAVVHVQGIAKLIGPEQLSLDLTRMIQYHENLAADQINEIITEEYKTKLIDQIVGFRIEILKMEGKFKLGQHKSKADQDSVLKNLSEQSSFNALALADFIGYWCQARA